MRTFYRRHAAAALLALLAIPAGSVGCSKGESDSSKPSSSSDSSKSGNDKSDSSEKKDPTAIKLTAEQQKLGSISTVRVEPTSVARTLEAPAQVMMDETRTTHLSPVSGGRVTEVLALPGDVVKRGQVLALVHSHEVHETIGMLEQALADVARRKPAVTFAEERAARYAHLYSIQAASLEESQRAQQDLLQAKNDLANAEVTVHTESEHLADLFQIPTSALDLNNLGAREEVPIRATTPGVVITRSVTPGSVIEPGTEAFTVSDLGTVWVVASVNEADLNLLHLGDAVSVHTDAWPDETFNGRVTLIGSTLDPATRTVQVRVAVANRLGRLKPQMFATVHIAGSATRQAIFVPESALIDVNGVPVVFTTDGKVFSPQTVKTARPVNGRVEVLEGLRPGQQLVTTGTFTLKSELLKGTIGEG